MPTRRRFIRVLAAGYASVATPVYALPVGEDPPDACPPPPRNGKPFTAGQDTRPIIARKSVAALSQTEIAELRKAFAALRALPKTDPRSWIMQADLHASYCRECTNVTTQVHGSWRFLPWHRAFLYYYERILGSLVGNINGFRLPYWNWENLRTFPQPYITPSNDVNPLWDNRRNASLLAGAMLPTNDASADRVAFLNDIADFTTFGGTETTGGALEIDPHNLLHVDIGMQEPPWTDMGNLGFSARDPLFFAHHANIDKIWSSWNLHYRNPEDAPFRTLRWTFYDEHGKPVSISAEDVLAHENRLRYAYLPSQTAVAGLPLLDIYPCRLRCCAHRGSILETSTPARERILSAARRGGTVAWVLPRVPIPSGFSGTFDIVAYRNGRKAPLGSMVIADDGMLARGNRRTALAFDVSNVIVELLDVHNPAGIYALPRYGGEAFPLSTQTTQLRIDNATTRQHAPETS